MAEGTAFKYGTGSWRGTDVADRRLVIDMSSKIGMLSPNETPFFVLLNQAGKMSAAQPKFEWMEDEDFITRSFTANWLTSATGDATHTVALLKLNTPADLQGLEAPPYQPSYFNYGLNGGDIYVKLVNVANPTCILYAIIEKAGVQGAGKWRTVGGSATGLDAAGVPFDKNLYTANSSYADGTAADAARTGYFVVMGCAADANMGFETATWPANSQLIRCTHTGVSTYDEAVVIGGGTADWAVTGTTGNFFNGPSASGAAGPADGVLTPVYVTVYTPNMAAGGFYEGSGLPEETRKGVRLLSNYTQIFKTPYSITNTAIASSYVGGPELARIRAKKGKQHKIDIEHALLFNGASSITTDADSPKRKTRGLGIGQTDKSGFIKTHHPGTYVNHSNSAYVITHVAATPGIAFWNDLSGACERIFDNQIQGSDSKVLYCSQKWLGAFTFNSNITTGWQMTQDTNPGSDTVFGVRVKGYQTAYGRVNIVGHPMLRGAYENYAFFVDMKNVSLKTLPGRQTHIVPNAQTADMDGLREYYLTEIGLKVEHEVTHGVLYLGAA